MIRSRLVIFRMRAFLLLLLLFFFCEIARRCNIFDRMKRIVIDSVTYRFFLESAFFFFFFFFAWKDETIRCHGFSMENIRVVYSAHTSNFLLTWFESNNSRIPYELIQLLIEREKSWSIWVDNILISLYSWNANTQLIW